MHQVFTVLLKQNRTALRTVVSPPYLRLIGKYSLAVHTSN